MSKTTSQNQKVYNRLVRHGSISRNWAFDHLAIGRLAGRIQDLKYAGLIYDVADETDLDRLHKVNKGKLGYVAGRGKKLGKPLSKWNDYFYETQKK